MSLTSFTYRKQSLMIRLKLNVNVSFFYRLRKSTYDRLILLSGGGLSRALGKILSLDTLAPVITDKHLEALDRRLAFVLSAVALCQNENGGINILS